MGKRKESSVAIDTLLKMLAMGTITGAALVAPNAVQILEKPLAALLKNLDEKEKARQLSKLRSYLKTRGYVRGDYDHGIIITKKAMDRLAKRKFADLSINTSEKWDNKWRLVMFDVPEEKSHARVALTQKLKSLGFQILQLSVWIHPYECREEIYLVAKRYNVESYVTYIITDHIDHEEKLIKRFDKLKLR